ncbi:hypothetical protein C8F04DRAFT_446773 [Mycena alexandri]|uniref:Uncharacterized protein n=1 Tax=Mycena alexandri TaxID=1745969 RepID=A0AAD6TKW9_9AGAR|nr:hypothetical protein C8F04DRAFT_446773 [Mycena alexandri]
MHSTIHSLAHRAPPATRSRVRWQPYNALASASASASTSSRSPSISYLSTPATSVSSSPPPKATPLCETERLRAHPSMPQTPRDPSNPPREGSKNKYATGLVDQAVKSLCEIWRPQDIPNVFLTSSRATVGSELPPPAPKSRTRNTQLPSPVSPLTQPSPPSPRSSNSPAARVGPVTLQCEQDLAANFGNRTNLVPIKGFVHEVLRRSRTSGSVLQTALCYLEAIRPKVPELIRKEQSGEGAGSQYDSESRVMPATAAELALEAQLSSMNFDFTAANRSDEDASIMDTVRVSYEDVVCTATPSSTFIPEDQTALSSENSTSASSTAPLPSPLLCPRRAFLASLILASKFTQDKCYSNRAWAKLSGLPAREIGRCERALGDALDWRLWVGKTPPVSQASSSTSTPAPATAGRPVVRCQSEGNLPIGKGPFLKKETGNSGAACSPGTTRPAQLRGLRRSSTLPADAFAAKEQQYNDPYLTSSSGSQYETTWNSEGHQLSFSNIAQQDELMGSPQFGQVSYLLRSLFLILSFSFQAGSPPSPSSTYSSQQYPSPIPSTPSLSYSPSSTESSSGGDRTIQMSTFMDDNMAALSHDVVVSCGADISSQWGATPSSPMLSGIAFEAAALDPVYATSVFAGVATAKPGHFSANAWPWASPTTDDYPASPQYRVGAADADPGLRAKFANVSASIYPGTRGSGAGLRQSGGVFPTATAYHHSHIH